jgi:hypothetical protein
LGLSALRSVIGAAFIHTGNSHLFQSPPYSARISSGPDTGSARFSEASASSASPSASHSLRWCQSWHMQLHVSYF